LLICTHGQRDRCCSLEGTPLFLALRDRPGIEVWQCSHIGGHRFAATALHLPSGYVWGRLRAEHADALCEGLTQSRLPLVGLVRGHSGLSIPQQLADMLVRAAEKSAS